MNVIPQNSLYHNNLFYVRYHDPDKSDDADERWYAQA